MQLDTLVLRPQPRVLLKQSAGRDVFSRWDAQEASGRTSLGKRFLTCCVFNIRCMAQQKAPQFR